MSPKKIVVSIHGIHTLKSDHDWQENLKDFFAKIDPSVEVINFKYGFVLGVVAWALAGVLGLEKAIRITKPQHPKYCDRFEMFLEDLILKNPEAELSIVAHSLGTWIADEVLHRAKYPIRNLILVSGVVSERIEDLDYLEWIQDGRVKQVVAWCSHNDELVEDIAIPPFGQLGYYGFIRKDCPSDVERPAVNPYLEVCNRQTEEGHSGVLDKLDFYGNELFRQVTS